MNVSKNRTEAAHTPLWGGWAGSDRILAYIKDLN